MDMLRPLVRVSEKVERGGLEKNFKILPTVKVWGYSVTVSLYDGALQGSSERVVIYTFSLGRRVD